MGFFLAGLLAGGLIWFAAGNLTAIAKWGIRRALPGVKVELGSLKFESPGRVAFHRFALRDPDSGGELIRLSGGSIVFSLGGLRSGKVGEVRLVNPVIHASPGLAKILPAGKGEGGKPPPWLISRFICEGGRVLYEKPAPGGLSASVWFAFDWKDVSAGGRELLELKLWEFQASQSDATAPFLRFEECWIRFSPEGLARHRVGEVRLVHPVLVLQPSILQLFSPGGGPGGAAPDWQLGRLVCDFGEGSFDGFGPDLPAGSCKFSFDGKDVGLQSAAPFELTAWDISARMPGFAEPFLGLDLVRLQGTLQEILDGHTLAAASVSGGRLVVGAALQKIFSGGSGGPSTGVSGLAWKLGTLDIRGVSVCLDDPREGISDIVFQLNTTLRDLSPAQAADVLGGTRQLIEIADLDVPSPLDPFTKVLTLRSIFVRFTLAGLLRQELDEITILHPTIYIGEDLFWYMDDAQKRLGGGKSASPGWKVRKLDIKFGRVVLGSGGNIQYGLPLNFQTAAQDLSLDNLAALKMQAGLEIPAQDYSFESYQLKLSTQKGELRFAYPPEKSENNLVGTIRLDRILWRQYRAGDAWISTTFDRTGINGEFGGRFYGGYVSGGFSFLFDDQSPWIGWLAGKGVDLKQLTDIVAPKNFRMTGPLAFKVQTNAAGHEIERLKGDFTAARPGRMTIGKLDDLLASFPETWSALKKSSARIALETLRDFDYTRASGDFWIVRQQGVLDLKLQGPQGSRTLKTVLHANESKEGRWKN